MRRWSQVSLGIERIPVRHDPRLHAARLHGSDVARRTAVADSPELEGLKASALAVALTVFRCFPRSARKKSAGRCAVTCTVTIGFDAEPARHVGAVGIWACQFRRSTERSCSQRATSHRTLRGDRDGGLSGRAGRSAADRLPGSGCVIRVARDAGERDHAGRGQRGRIGGALRFFARQIERDESIESAAMAMMATMAIATSTIVMPRSPARREANALSKCCGLRAVSCCSSVLVHRDRRRRDRRWAAHGRAQQAGDASESPLIGILNADAGADDRSLLPAGVCDVQFAWQRCARASGK